MAPEKLTKEERDHIRRVLAEGKKISNESLRRSIARTPVANRHVQAPDRITRLN
jgi:hypothetical protein